MPLLGYKKGMWLYYVTSEIHKSKHEKLYLYLLFATALVFFSISLVVLLRENMEKKLLIIEHSSIQKMNFSYDKAELEEYAVKKIEINQYNTINNSTLSLEAKVPLLITEIYNVLTQINNYVEKHYQVGYAGIPVGNVPSAFMLGYELDDANKKLYFHKNRSSNIDDNFHLLKDAHSSIKLIVNKQENREYDIGDLMVIIQLTQPIKDNDLDGVLGNNDYILRYEVPEQIDYDIIETAEQANKYAQQIVSEIAKIQKRSNISKIKICIAASSDFIFALDTKFSKTQNIDIIVYQFDKGRYSWRINISKGTAVINDM